MSLLQHNVIEDLKPIGGGWRYLQRFGGGFVRIPTSGSAKTAADLLEQVRDFRINNGINMGDPDLDVAEYIKKQSPHNDRYRGSRPGRIREPDFVPLIQRIREWLDDTLPRRPLLVAKTDADDRAAICLNCPHNVEWKIKCEPCVAEIEYRAINLRCCPSHDLDKELGGCRIQGLHIASAIFIDQDALPRRTDKNPTNCWLPK